MRQDTKKIKTIFLFLLTVIAAFALGRVSSNQKIEEVLAYSDNSVEYFPANTQKNDFDRQKPYEEMEFNASVKDFDKRTFVLEQYFIKNNSPLAGAAKHFTDACNKFSAPKDCTIVAAIAMNETHLCKYSTSAEMHNCWGFGGPGIHRQKFSSFEEGIYKVTDVLSNQYGYIYMIDPSLMERTFCGWEPGCTNWGNKIKVFMNEINELSKSLDMGDLFALREN